MSKPAMSVPRILLAITALIIAAAIIEGLHITGGPQQQRLYRFDEQRLQSLSQLAQQVQEHQRVHQELPENLKDLRQQHWQPQKTVDPASGQPYEYRKLGSNRFALCANFQTDDSRRTGQNPYTRTDLYLENEAHPIGKFCFEFVQAPNKDSFTLKGSQPGF